MPAVETVEQFVKLVEDGRFVEAIEQFYHAGASMQENDAPPRTGRDALVESERRFLGTLEAIQARRLAPPMIAGDHVAIRWRFDIRPRAGRARVLDEIAFQIWQDEQIIEEKFFYDPRQLGR